MFCNSTVAVPVRTGTGKTRLEFLIQGTGRLLRGSETVPVAGFTLRGDPYDFDGYWAGTLYVAAEQDAEADRLIYSDNGSLRFEGMTDHGRSIEISALYPTFGTRGRIEFEAYEVDYYTNRLDRIPDQQYAHARLTPTDLAIPEVFAPVLHWTGEIKTVGSARKERKITFSSELGTARFALSYTFEDTLVGSEKALVRIPVPVIYFKIQKRHYLADSKLLLDRVAKALADPLAVLSFLSRRHVRWSRIEAGSRWTEEAGQNFDEASRYARPRVRIGRREWAPLVHLRRMPKDGLSAMIHTYRNLPYREAVAAAILYLNVSANAEFIETTLVNAFTALEAAVSAVAKDAGYGTTLGSSAFKALSNKLSDEIATFGGARHLSSDTIATIQRKLPELRRPPIVDQVTRTIEGLGVEWGDVWNSGSGLHDQLQAAFSRRNAFIHTGHIASVSQAHVDAYRVHATAERLIYHLLGGDPEWFTQRTFEHIRRLQYVRLESGT